jgi:hypothetical protein
VSLGLAFYIVRGGRKFFDFGSMSDVLRKGDDWLGARANPFRKLAATERNYLDALSAIRGHYPPGRPPPDPAQRSAILRQGPPSVPLGGNASTLMAFRVSAADAEMLAPEYHPLPAPELANQPPFQAWLRRLDTDHHTIFLEPPLYRPRNRRRQVVAQSRRNFGRPRAFIERTFAG